MREMSPNRAHSIDDTHFPLVDVVMGDGHRDEDWLWLLKAYERLYAQKRRYAHIVDASTIIQPPYPTARKIITEWIAKNATETERWNVCTSVVMNSGLMRGALTAMTWMMSKPVPMHYSATYSESLDWCVKNLERESLPVPFAIRQRQSKLLSEPPPAPGQRRVSTSR